MQKRLHSFLDEDCEKDSERVEKLLEEEAHGNFSKKIIIAMLTLLVIFVAIVLRHFISTGMEPTTLIISVFSLFTGQFGLMAWLMKHKRDSVYREITTYREGHNMPFPLVAEEVDTPVEDEVDAHTREHHFDEDHGK